MKRIEFKEVQICYTVDFLEGPLEGLCKYDGNYYFFDYDDVGGWEPADFAEVMSECNRLGLDPRSKDDLFKLEEISHRAFIVDQNDIDIARPRTFYLREVSSFELNWLKSLFWEYRKSHHIFKSTRKSEDLFFEEVTHNNHIKLIFYYLIGLIIRFYLKVRHGRHTKVDAWFTNHKKVFYASW